MESEKLALLIVGMMLVTYLPRLAPALFFSRNRVPEILRIWLTYVPGSIIAAMLAPSLLITDGRVDLSASNLTLLVAVPTFVIACVTRSLVITVLAGVAIASLAKAAV